MLFAINHSFVYQNLLSSFHLLGLLLIIKAAITPGIQPKQVKIKTIINEPQPLSITAKGGKIIQSITLKMPILDVFQ
jgi:hypothetical protein